jgi:hypothetical protein
MVSYDKGEDKMWLDIPSETWYYKSNYPSENPFRRIVTENNSENSKPVTKTTSPLHTKGFIPLL